MVIAKSKKVKLQMTNTIKSMDYTWQEPYNEEAGAPKALFVPHSNSLPFEERRISLENPVQIGRNVYRATPSPTNTIFDCRVLSRHHATLYYDKGHFYLVDNQSSNGTFINNNRCSISKEQEPHEVFSGDVVQFGIPVVENASNSEKITFPPVVAMLKLYHPNGKEAKLTVNPTMTTPLHLKNLYQLNNFIQEAVQREASLESRLRTLRECVERTRAEAAASWELFVGEQRLLMRVHTLEAMLAAGKTPDAQSVVQLLNDKRNYQEVAQESLRAAHEQRIALEEALERRGREAAALHTQNCALRAAANNALAELQKLAARCESKMLAARLAISAAEEREQAVREQLPLAYSVQNGEAKMLILSTDSNKVPESRRGSLTDAVRALPDYIKLLLPQNLLNEVGIKAVSADDKSSKEFELILKKNNMLNSESKDNFTEKEQHEEGVSSSGEEKSNEDNICTDDEKQCRLNHDPGHEVENSDGDIHADNNANSTYSESSNKEDSPSKAGVEYANVLRVMAGLNEEIKVLRERLAAVGNENEQLRGVRDELLAAHDRRDEPPADTEDVADYKARIADLQAQVSRSTVSEEANMAEISRLATRTAEMQAELAFRPTRADIDELALIVESLRNELEERDETLARLRQPAPRRDTVDRAVSPAPEPAPDVTPDVADLSAEIDEMFRLDDGDDDDEETDSAATEVASAPPPPAPAPADYVRLDDETRLQTTLSAGSLHALEEELVRAKERWADACSERAALARQLASLRDKRSMRLAPAHALALALPLLAAALYCLLLPHLS